MKLLHIVQNIHQKVFDIFKKKTIHFIYVILFLLGYKQILDTVMDKEVNPEGMVAVNVFYKESKLKEIVEEPALTGEIYVSQLGGAIGLFLGCSMLSLVEILEVLLELLVLGIISVI